MFNYFFNEKNIIIKFLIQKFRKIISKIMSKHFNVDMLDVRYDRNLKQ